MSTEAAMRVPPREFRVPTVRELPPTGIAPVEIIRAREDERQLLSRELDDGVGAALAKILFAIGAASPAPPSDAGRALARIQRDLADATQELRRLIIQLRPPALEELGLAGALRRHAEELRGAPLRLTVSDDHMPSGRVVPPSIELAAYRIACQAMSDAAHRAGATFCSVDLSLVDGELRVSVCSDGAPEDGPGPEATRDWARQLGGRCECHARPSGATRVLCVIPLPRRPL